MYSGIWRLCQSEAHPLFQPFENNFFPKEEFLIFFNILQFGQLDINTFNLINQAVTLNLSYFTLCVKSCNSDYYRSTEAEINCSWLHQDLRVVIVCAEISFLKAHTSMEHVSTRLCHWVKDVLVGKGGNVSILHLLPVKTDTWWKGRIEGMTPPPPFHWRLKCK